MPGTGPAGSTPPTPTDPDTTGFTYLGSRRRARTTDRQEPDMGTAHDDQPFNPEVQLAETIQALYLHRRRTLTDPDTAEAYDIAIEAAILVVDGAQMHGHIDDDQHQVIAGMLQAARRAPHAL